MSNEITRIQKMLEENWNGKMWYGGNLKEILAGVTSEKAFRSPGAGSHNIYELVQHILCWRKFVIEMLKGNSAYKVVINSETDWPVNYEKTEESWNQALKALESSQMELMQLLNGFDESRLEELIPGRKFNRYTLLHGLLHHDIYHSAQISILKK